MRDDIYLKFGHLNYDLKYEPKFCQDVETKAAQAGYTYIVFAFLLIKFITRGQQY